MGLLIDELYYEEKIMLDIEIVQTLMYTIGLLIIMVYPAMRIADWLSEKIEIGESII